MSDSNFESVRLHRGVCFGDCPAYEVILSRDGTATWRGEAFTERLGEHRGEVWEGDFESLARVIESCGFFDWDDSYSEPITDAPTYELEVRKGGVTKKVVQYATDERADFWSIATLIDGICAHIDWTPSTE
jgi:hypothetical protein